MVSMVLFCLKFICVYSLVQPDDLRLNTEAQKVDKQISELRTKWWSFFDTTEHNENQYREQMQLHKVPRSNKCVSYGSDESDQSKNDYSDEADSE